MMSRTRARALFTADMTSANRMSIDAAEGKKYKKNLLSRKKNTWKNRVNHKNARGNKKKAEKRTIENKISVKKDRNT